MAGEAPDETLGGEAATAEPISRLRGTVFKWISAAATMFGITVVSLLLLYVANDAIAPLSADPGWHLVFFLTLVAPTVWLTGYYLRSNRAAGKVGYETLGILVVGLILAGGLVILFLELISPPGWLALVVALVVAGAAVLGHGRARPEAAVERLFVLIGAPVLSVFGIPAMSIDFTLVTPLTGTELVTIDSAIPQLLPSVRAVVLALPFLPLDWVSLVGSLTLPAGYALGTIVARRRDDDRGQLEFAGGLAVLAGVAALVAPFAGLSAVNGVLLTTALFAPSAFYLEGVVRRGHGLTGLLFPVVVVGGVLVGALVTDVVGFAGPNAWLDWGFMTNATTRFNPREAGIYPALVGSVLIIIVIALTAFPVGVAAAIYLEEYAPDSGLVGRIVGLIEINIGNLAGVPSIVYGLLGLALFVQGIGLRQGIVVVGGLTVGLLILPIVIISAQEAVRAVPDSRRRASYGMGATRWQTIRNVVLPEALPGILTGTILALGRAIGETAPLLMIGIASSVRSPPTGFFSKTGAMPRQIFSWSSEIEPAFRFGVLAAGVMVLVGVLVIMNGTAIILRNRYQRNN